VKYTLDLELDADTANQLYDLLEVIPPIIRESPVSVEVSPIMGYEPAAVKPNSVYSGVGL